MAPAPGLQDLDLPARIGRFEVLGRLGQGGMGQVLRARDPQLGREVAIKLLHADVDPVRAPLHAEVARRRLLREAQAMARLDHPNVIGVHEVGDDDGQVFLVMERVSGTTLTGWLAAAARPWRDVLAVFAQVGAGLAAAHAVGLIHRDVKPDNVLVGGDGRVRVTDFGLVGEGPMVAAGPASTAIAPPTAATAAVTPAPATSAAPSDTAIDPHAPTSESLPAPLTHQGALVGTPGYMAPEQVRGEAADARSDQFALCVALYEALYGRPPFAGDSHRARMVAVLDGAVGPPPSDTDVPPAVTAAVLRGLAHAPADRWPDVPALLAALAAATAATAATTSVTPSPVAAPNRPGRRWWLGPVAALAVAGAASAVWRTRAPGAVATVAPSRPPPPPPWPLPASAVETLIDSGGCDGHPVPIDDHTLVYRHLDPTGIDLRVRDLVTGADRALTSTPDVDEMSPQPVIGARAVVALPRRVDAAGAGASRIDLDTGVVTPLAAGAGISFAPGAIIADGAIYYVLGDGSQLIELRDGVARELATFPGAAIAAMTVDPRGRAATLAVAPGMCTVDLVGRGAPVCYDDLDGPYGKPAVDGRGRIYYAGLAGLRRHDPATGEDVVLVADRGANGGLAVSAAGDALFFSECQPQIEITAVADGAVVHAESLTRAQLNRLGAWAFIRETPSASLLAYRDPDGLVHVLTHAAQGTATEPALEPDGDRIVFFLVGPAPGLYLASGQSHRPIRKLSDKALAAAVWIDSGHVAATLTHDDGRPYVHIVDIETGEDHQALPRPRLTADRQPDGDLVLLASEDRSRLFLWEPATGREREVPLPPEVAHRQILEAELAAGGTAIDMMIGPTVWRVAVTGGPARQVYAPPGRKGFWGIEIGPDDRRYVLLSEERGALYRVELPALPPSPAAGGASAITGAVRR